MGGWYESWRLGVASQDWVTTLGVMVSVQLLSVWDFEVVAIHSHLLSVKTHYNA